jgi:hypothetical protein
MAGPMAERLPPAPVEVARYFLQRRSRIAELAAEDIHSGERLWAEICGVPYIETRVMSRDEAARLDDPFREGAKYGPVGQLSNCRGCGLKFESRGLRFCPDCYSALGDPAERTAASAAERSVRKQTCRQCGGDLPRYGAGARKRMVTAVFCSPVCKARARRQRHRVPANRPSGATLPGAGLPGTKTALASSQRGSGRG